MHHGELDRGWSLDGVQAAAGGTTCCSLEPGHIYGERREHRVAFNCSTVREEGIFRRHMCSSYWHLHSCACSPAGATASSPYGSPLSVSMACGKALPSQGYWKELSLPTSCTSICTNTWAAALTRLTATKPPQPSAMQARFPWKAGGGPANPIPSPLGNISSSRLLSTDAIWQKAA